MPDRSRRKPAPRTEPKRAPKRPSPDAEPAPDDARIAASSAVWDDRIRLARRALPFVGLFVATVAGLLTGLGTAILVLAATALLMAISTLWTSLQLIAGEGVASSEDAAILTAPGSEFEQKQALLRALKDLDFERSMGKISEEDYVELRDRYRARAKTVLQTLDRELEPVRAEAEKLADSYLRSKGFEPAATTRKPEASTDDDPGNAETPDVEAGKKPRAYEPAKPPEVPSAPPAEPSRKCPSCSAVNDLDAAFCKKCGHRLEHSLRPEAGAES